MADSTDTSASGSRPARISVTGVFPTIADYGFLSDCENNALISSTGAVEWMCLPRPDSPSVFGAILDRSAGHFRRALVPVHDAAGELLLAEDETIRPQTSPETLAALAPSFVKLGARFDALALRKYPQAAAVEHRHHAGNSSGIVDGAALVLVGSRAGGEAAGLEVRVNDSVQTGVRLIGPDGKTSIQNTLVGRLERVREELAPQITRLLAE